jgi:hypothetical protein
MSFIADAISPKKPKVEPVPTRDTAADAVDTPEEERKKKINSGYGAGTLMLTGPGGVTGELTGTRSANG